MKNLILLMALIFASHSQAATKIPLSMIDAPGMGLISHRGTCPKGTLQENGASVLRSSYPKLFAQIGTSHGNGSTNPTGVTADTGCPHASDCFNLPDTRGRFIRGVDEVAGRDPDKASRTAQATGGSAGNNVGSVQGDMYGSHSHDNGMYANETPGEQKFGMTPDDGATRMVANSATVQVRSGYTSTDGGSETRPENIYANFCILY